MGNKYEQTVKAKENFESRLLAYMLAVTTYDPKHIFTKEELIDFSGTSDRAVRREMEMVANYYPILSFSSKKGYRYAFFNEHMDVDELKSLRDNIQHSLNELQSRVESLQARMKPLIALKAKLDEHILEVDWGVAEN